MTHPPQGPENPGQEPPVQPQQPAQPQQPPLPQYGPPIPPQPQYAPAQPQYAPPQVPPGQPPQQPPQYGAPNAPYQPPQPQAPMNVLAIIAFVSSFFVSLAGIICGHIALSQIKRTGERGRGFALAGTIIGYVSAAFTVIALLLMFLFWSIFATFLWGVTSSLDEGAWDDDYTYSYSAYGPESMESGAAVFDDWLEPEWTPGLAEGESRIAPVPNPAVAPLEVTVYVDYMCPACGAFEEEYGDALEDLLEQGEIKLGVYPVTFLNPVSGTEYSTRAANLFGCVVEHDPYAAWDVHRDLLDGNIQPAEGTGGLTDDELLVVAENAGAWIDDGIETCVRDEHFAAFFEDNTTIATTEGLLGLAPGAEPSVLQSTPTVIIDGEHWDQAEHPDLESYLEERVSALR